jgi:hypothetical protein
MKNELTARANLKNAPKIAEQIGHLCVIWAAMEFRLFRIFCLLSDLPIPLARSMFYSQRTTRARIDAVLAIAPMILRKKRGNGTTADHKKLKKLLGDIGRLAGERNKYVHDTWGGLSETSPRAFQFRMSGDEVHGRYQAVNQQDIVRLIGQIETKRGALWRFSLRLAPKMKALHEKLGRPPVLLLEPATRGIRLKKTKAKRLPPPRSLPPLP